MTRLYDLPENLTRQHLIDEQLWRAGWSLESGNVVEELRLPHGPKQLSERRTNYRTTNEFVDYTLLGQDGKPLAIIEAKRTSRDAIAGKRQAEDYAITIQKLYGVEPFIFFANGQDIWFWDRSLYPPRTIQGFFTPRDLERLSFQQQYRQPLTSISPNNTIVNRPYQFEAIRCITEAISRSRRKFLLVMATGTGKTRTTIAFIDLLMRAKWAQRVLFLADRRELVRQALGDFKDHMPNETRARIEGGEVDETARIHVATYPSMMQVYTKLSPGYYDLIVADESHRSIYNRYRVLLEHFDALQLGLTATPTDYIDHNTFKLFECEDGLPTFYYAYETAVEENYLVNYRVLAVQTSFQLEGIKADQLPPEIQRQLVEQNIELSEVDFEGSDLDHRVTNTGTTDAMVDEIMEKCRKDASGTLPAKTIIFAISHAHAVRIWESFNRRYPELQRLGMAEIIDSHMERADKTLDDFKRRDMPRIAISVDMLDTGIDVPSIQNLVFAKPVFSQVKFWQMIGRGTRLWMDPQTGQAKRNFLIIDFWNNFSYFNMNPEGEVARPTEALPVRLFRIGLEKLALLRSQNQEDAAAETVAGLQTLLSQIPHENVNVRPHLDELQQLRQADAWQVLDEAQVEHLSKTIAPLLRYLTDVNLQIMTFEVRAELLAVAHLAGQMEQVEKIRQRVLADLAQLPMTLREVQAQAEKIVWVRSTGFWDHLDYARIADLKQTFAPLMRYSQPQRQEVIHLHLPDEVASRRWILYGPSGEGAFADTYRGQVETAIRRLAHEHPTLRKLRQDQPVTDDDVQALVATLNRPDLYIREEVLRQVYEQPESSMLDFVRHILGLARLPSREEEITIAFDGFIATHPQFSAAQIRFLRAVRSVVLRQTRLTAQDLQRAPFSRIGNVSKLFNDHQVQEILEFANRLAA